MKKLFLLASLMVCFGSFSQAQSPSGNPSVTTNSWYKLGFVRPDSGYIWTKRDTFLAKYPTVIWHTNGSFYQTGGGTGSHWSLFGGSGGSQDFNSVLTIGNTSPLGFTIGTRSGYSTNINGSLLSTSFASKGYVDSIASTPTLNQVLTAGNNSLLSLSTGELTINGGALKINTTSANAASITNNTSNGTFLLPDTSGTFPMYFKIGTTVYSPSGTGIVDFGTLAGDTSYYAPTHSLTQGRYANNRDSNNAVINTAMALKLNISDTSTMLSPYLRNASASSLYVPFSDSSNRVTGHRTNARAVGDSTLLAGLIAANTSNIALKINITDTSVFSRAAKTETLTNKTIVSPALTGTPTIQTAVTTATQFTYASQRYMYTPTSAALNVSTMTLCGWVYMDDFNAAHNYIIAAKDDDSSVAGSEFILAYEVSTQTFGFAVLGAAHYPARTPVMSAIRGWNFVCGWYDSATLKTYISVNNSIVYEGDNVILPLNVTSTPFTIGANRSFSGNAGSWMNGKLASVALFKRVITEAERIELWNNGLGQVYSTLSTGIKIGLNNWYDLAGASGVDAVGNNNMTLVNTPTSTTGINAPLQNGLKGFGFPYVKNGVVGYTTLPIQTNDQNVVLGRTVFKGAPYTTEGSPDDIVKVYNTSTLYGANPGASITFGTYFNTGLIGSMAEIVGKKANSTANNTDGNLVIRVGVSGVGLVEKLRLLSNGGLVWENTSVAPNNAIQIIRSNNDGGATPWAALLLRNSNPTAASGSDYNIAGVTIGAGNGTVNTQIIANYGTGAGAPFNFGSGMVIATRSNHAIMFSINDVLRWQMNTSGHFIAGTDNSYDIGASGATRPRTGYFGTSVVAPTLTVATAINNSGAYTQSGSSINTFTGVTSLVGSSSGVVTLQTQAVAGTYNWNYPITAGTSGQVLTSGGGSSTAMTWSTPTVSIPLQDFIADVSNSGSAETDIFTYTLAANGLSADKQKIEFGYTINLTDLTATAQIKTYMAGTVTANTGALTVSATGSLMVTGYIIRTSSTTARVSVNIASPTASTAVYTNEIDLTSLDFTTTNIIKVTAQAGGGTPTTGDCVGKMGFIKFTPASP